MLQIMKDRTRVLKQWICILAVMCSQFGLFTLRAAAQEPTTEPTALPTPTPAPTWTPIPTPTNTPDPAVTPTTNPTASARLVDFRVDDDEITKGECVTFSWVVRGDIDRVEFDQLGDGKVPLLVSDMDSREECPEEDTTYELDVTWLDGTNTERSIKIEVDEDDAGDNSGDSDASSGTPTPAGTASFVPVTPIPVIGTPQASYQDASGSIVVTPVGVLGSVQTLPETGYWSSPDERKIDGSENGVADQGTGSTSAIRIAVFLAIVVVGSALRTLVGAGYRNES